MRIQKASFTEKPCPHRAGDHLEHGPSEAL
jgi:hypothetical protein